MKSSKAGLFYKYIYPYINGFLLNNFIVEMLVFPISSPAKETSLMPRMKIFNALEEETFKSPPVFNSVERKKLFTLPAGLTTVIEILGFLGAAAARHPDVISSLVNALKND